MPDFLKIAQDAYASSTDYIDANYRKQWEANIRAFQSKHPVGSKYLSDAFKYRSKGFRPKTRTIIRKNEAAAAVALFSNMDVVNVDAVDQDDPTAVASAFVGKELLQYRLTKTIPWFKLCLGAYQDAMTVGVVCSYQYWKYESKDKKMDVPGVMNEDGSQAQVSYPHVSVDEPCIELRPVENIRIDPAADWLDPINSSPYLIDIISMYVVDVKKMMTSNDKTGEPKWKTLSDEELSEGKSDPDPTRQQREPHRQDRYDNNNPPDLKDFDTVWVHRNFVRLSEGEFVYYTLGTKHLLSTPKKVSEVYKHMDGKRPYVMGICVIESHRTLPSGLADLTHHLQAEANEISNQRRDNVKLVLDKRYFVARGKQVDVDSLVRNVPGGVTLMTDVNMDAREISWPDVTSSAYQEQDRINADFDELAGNFSGSTRQANTGMNDTLGGAKLGHASESMMQDYLLRTFIESWVEPVLKQFMKLEQEYETDTVIIGLAQKKAQLFKKFGMNQVTDDMLTKDLSLVINVGMGATSPDERLKKFLTAVTTAAKLSVDAPPGMNLPEVNKEIFSYAGFRDGERFFPSGGNPQLQKAMQVIQQLHGQLQSKEKEQQAKNAVDMAQIRSNENINGAKLRVDANRIQGDLRIREAELVIEKERLEIDKLQMVIDAQVSTAEKEAKRFELAAKMREAQARIELARLDIAKARIEIHGDAMKTAHELTMMKHERSINS